MNDVIENTGIKALNQSQLDDILKLHARFLSGQPGGARASVKDTDLSNLNFEGADLSQSDFTGCVFRGANLKKVAFTSATLFGCDFSKCNIQHANFSRADLRGTDIQLSDLTNANFSKADLRTGSSVVKQRRTKDLYGRTGEGRVTFNGSIMTNANFKGASANMADFSDALLENANFEQADLRDAILDGANLSNVEFDGADLRSASFNAANMTGAHMANNETRGAIFTMALSDDNPDRENEEFSLTKDELILKHQQWVESAGRQGEKMNLSHYDLRKLKNLSDKRLTALVASHAVFAGLNLQNLEIQSAQLNCADFRECDLRFADFRGSHMEDAVFVRANMTKVNCGPLVLKQQDGSIRNIPCCFSNAIMRFADCKEGDFRHADFSSCDLTHAEFDGADLSYAKFSGANLEAASLKGAKTEGTIFDDDYSIEE